MRYLRKFQNVNPAHGRHISLLIPPAVRHIFDGTNQCFVEETPDGKAIIVKPAKFVLVEE